MSNAWFENQVAPDGITEDGCHPQEAQALKDFFNNKTTSSEVALAITRPVARDEHPDRAAGGLFGLLMDPMMELSPQRRVQTICLIRAIETLPLHQFERPFGMRSLWNDDLKKLGWRRNMRGLTAQDERYREQRARFQEVAALEAQMIVAGIGSILVDYGLICIADTLESSTAILDIELPATYEWVSIAGKAIRDSTFPIWATGAKRDLYKSSNDDRGVPLDTPRILFWIDRLRTIVSSDLDVSQETKECANACLTIMSEWV